MALLIACCIGIYAASEYYKDDRINHAAEFPWCLLSIIIGTIFIFIGAILYTVIICKWHKYADKYDFRRWSSKEQLQTGRYSSNNYRSGSNYKETNKSSSYSVPAFSFPPLAISNSVGMTSSLVGKGSNASLARTYQHDRFRRTRSETGISTRSLHDSPAIMRSPHMKVYVAEHDDYLNRLRGSREIIPRETTSDYVTVHQPYYSAISIPRSDPNLTTSGDPNVLDIIYRESRRSNEI